jgi:ATP-dependent DNA helicase RecQ
MEKIESEVIFSKLVSLRREIAENAGVVPRGIISDVALKKISEVLPATEAELKRVTGISQLFVQKFAKIFLVELEKIKLNPKEQKVSKVASDALKLISQGLSFEELKKRLFANNLIMAANYMVELIDARHKLDRKMFVPDEIYTKVKAYIKKHPETSLRDMNTAIPFEIEPPVLKMAAAFAKIELELKK